MKKELLFMSLIGCLAFSANGQSDRFASMGKNTNKTVSSSPIGNTKLMNAKAFKKSVSSADIKAIDAKSTNMLKASQSADATLTALFTRPAGTYIPSISGNSDPEHLGYSYSYAGYFGSAYSIPWTFRNLSTGATSYSWDWGTTTGYSTAQNVVIQNDADKNYLSPGTFHTPVLNASDGSSTLSYALASTGTEYPSTLFSSSGTMYVGNADYYGNTAQKNTNGNSIFYVSATGGTSLSGTGTGYFWGSCKRAADGTNGTLVHAIYSFYEKPMSPLIVKDICYFALNADGNTTPIPADKYLSVAVIKLDSNGKITTDTIGSSTIGADDLIIDEYDNVYLPATFAVIDPETGRESPTDLIISDPFVVVLSGFDQDGIDLGLLSDYANKIEGTSSFSKVDAVTKAWDGKLYSSSSNKMNVYLTLNSYFNYLKTDASTSTLAAPTEGGSATNADNEAGAIIYSFNGLQDATTGDATLWIDETSLPDWLSLTYDDSYFEEYNAFIFDFTADPLPSGVTGRTATVKFQSFGVEATVTINQGVVSGINNTKASKVSVKKVFNSFEVSKVDNYTSVALLNVAGQVINKYPISGGTISIPASKLANGVYLLKFEGKGSEVVKVVK